MSGTKSAIKENFQDGDRPSQAECSSWIDSTLFFVPGLQGLYQVQSTASATSLAYSTLGIRVLGSQTKNTARGLLNLPAIGTAGADIFRATSALAALSALGIVSAGQLIVQTSATASVWTALAISSAAKTLAEATATSQITDALDFIGTDANSSLIEYRNTEAATGLASSAAIFVFPSAASQTKPIELWISKIGPRQTIFPKHDFLLQFRRQGQTTFDNGASAYSWQQMAFLTAATQVSANESSAAVVVSDDPGTAGGNVNQSGFFGLIKINNWNNPNQFTTTEFDGGYVRRNPEPPMIFIHSESVYQTVANVDAIRLAFVSGSVTNAKISVILAD